MRKNKWLKLTAVILCMAMLLIGLVACVDDPEPDPDPDPKPVEEKLSDALDTVTKRLQNSYVVNDAKYFSVDVLADAELNTLGEGAGRIWKYEILAKANIKLIEDATEDETSMRVEFNAYNKDSEGKDVKTTLFGIFYENEVSDKGKVGNYFYVTVAGSEPIKANALSILKLVQAVAPEAVADLEGMDIGSIITMVLNLLISDFEAVDNDYVFSINLLDAWNTVYGLLSEVVDLENIASIGDMLGGTAGEIVNMILSGVDGSIADIFPDLTYNEYIEDDYNTPDVDETQTIVHPVDSIYTLLQYVDQNMPNIDVNVGLNFDSKDIFESAAITAKYQARTEDGVYNNPTHEFKLNASRVYVGAHKGVVVDEGYALTAEERAAMNDVVNLLNFSINGTLEMTKKGKVEVLPYSINADINPFVLIDGLTMDNIKKLGYLNITVDAPEAQEYRNIITIHSDFSSGAIYLNFKPYGNPSMLQNLNIGGKIDIAALFDAITIMSGGKVEVASVAEEGGDDVLTGILEALFGALNFSDIKNDGVVVDTSAATIKSIFKNIDLGDFLANMVFPGIVRELLFDNADAMAVKVNENGIKYGQCERIGVKDIDFTAFRSGDVVGIDSPKFETEIMAKYEYGQPLTEGITWNGKAGDAAQSFNVKGKDSISGKSNTIMSAKYLGSTYDPYKVGEQKIRIYFAANNNFNSLAGLAAGAIQNLLAGMPMLPINGIQYIETTVTVYEPVDEETTFVDVRGVSQMGVGENVAELLDGYLIYENGRTVAITSDMISCKKDILENGKIMYPGEWTLDVNYFTAHATVNIYVGELFVNDVAAINVGKDDIIKTLNPRIKLLNNKGYFEYNNCDTEIVSIVLDGKSVNATDVFVDNNSYVIKPNHNWLGKTLTISLEYDMFGMTRTRELSFTLAADDIAISNGTTSFYFNAPYNNLAKITKDGVSYYVRYNKTDSKFEAYSVKDDNEVVLAGYNITMTIKQVKDGEGKILDAPKDLDLLVGYFRTAGEYAYDIKVGDAYFTSSFTVNNPIVGDKTQSKKDKFYLTSSWFSLYIDGTTLVGNPKNPMGVNTVSIKYMEAETAYAPCVQLADDTYKSVGKITYKDSEGNDVVPKFHSKSGSTNYLTLDKAGTYTVTLTVEIGGVEYSATSTLNFTLSAK